MLLSTARRARSPSVMATGRSCSLRCGPLPRHRFSDLDRTGPAGMHHIVIVFLIGTSLSQRSWHAAGVITDTCREGLSTAVTVDLLSATRPLRTGSFRAGRSQV